VSDRSASPTRSSSACSSSSGVGPFTLFARGFLATALGRLLRRALEALLREEAAPRR